MVARTTFVPGRLVGVALSLVVMACQAGDLMLPADGSPSDLRAVSGYDQQGTVGTELPEPLVALVTDAAGRPVRQVSLRFQTEVPGAQLQPALVSTNDSGYAEVRMRLGTTEGTQTVEARLEQGAATGLKTTFVLTAFADQRPDDDEGDGGGEGDGDDDGEGDDHGGGNGGKHDRGKGHGHGHDHDDHDHDDHDHEDEDD
jgi:hypothetical protein